MIFKALSWIRLLIALLAMYVFLYEYMFKKYFYELHLLDEFYWKNRESKIRQIESFFNSQFHAIEASHFTYSQKSRPLCKVGPLTESTTKDSLTEPKTLHRDITQDESSVQDSLVERLFVQKVDSYILDFYNWFRFEFIFTDLGHDSYLQFRLIQIKKGSHQIVQKIPFSLPHNFYALNLNDSNNKLNINYKGKGISLNITQTFYPAHYHNPESDGLETQKFFLLTPNKSSITEEQYLKFGSAKTLTQFNFSLERKDQQVKANLTHVIRHNQCSTTQQNGKIRHKCMGGYGKGKLGFSQFIRQDINIKEKRYTGNWERNSYNLDNSRVRTTFIGQRIFKQPFAQLLRSVESLKKLYFSDAVNTIQSKKLTYNSVEMDFLGFHKLEYYAKHDKIQKERWVGMSLYQTLDQNGLPVKTCPHENNFFVNGNIHRIHNLELSTPLVYRNLQEGQVIRFMNSKIEDELGEMTPTFDIEFQVSHMNVFDEKRLWGQKKVYRVDGYWKGWIDEGVLFKDEKLRSHYNETTEFGYVSFYEIMGTIKFTEHLV